VKPDGTLVTGGDDLVPGAKPKPTPAYAPNYGGNTKAANELARAKKEPVQESASATSAGS
jgi:hypothetical protein